METVEQRRLLWGPLDISWRQSSGLIGTDIKGPVYMALFQSNAEHTIAALGSASCLGKAAPLSESILTRSLTFKLPLNRQQNLSESNCKHVCPSTASRLWQRWPYRLCCSGKLSHYEPQRRAPLSSRLHAIAAPTQLSQLPHSTWLRAEHP
jgi:hypothetical protein